jgi:hypothetical protein
MTAVEEYEACLQELEYQQTASMTPDEFNHHYKIAQYEWIKTRFAAYEQNTKAIEDLQVAKVVTDGLAGQPAPLQNAGQNIAGREYFILPTDLLFITNVRGRVIYNGMPCPQPFEKDGKISDFINSEFLSDDQVGITNYNKYTSPLAKWPRMKYTRRDNKMLFQAGKSIVFEVELTYIKEPLPARVDYVNNVLVSLNNSIWKEAQQREIIKWTVLNYLGKIEEQGKFQNEIALTGRMFEQTPPPNTPL